MFKRLLALLVAMLFGAGVMIVTGGSAEPPSGTLDAHFAAGYPGRLFVGDVIVYDGTPTTTTTTEAPTSTASASTTTTVEPSTSTTTVPSTSSTTTVPPSTSTSTSTTTTAPPAASTTTASSTSTSTTSPAGSPACGLAAAAFCETFDAPHNGGTQTGDLDPVLWGVSRVGDWNPGEITNGITPSHNACAGGALTPPPGDARVCGGQYVESENDGGAVTAMDSYPKQPFSFTGRTGKVVFDVSADSEGSHAAWPEFVITDAPVPGVHRAISVPQTPHAQNEIGFTMSGGDNHAGGVTGVDQFFMSRNGVYSDITANVVGTVTKGSRAAMNHIEVRVSISRIEVWGTDAGAVALRELSWADIPNGGLAFSQGLVWINDVHYNARKAIEPGALGTQWDHSFAWDNLGFDGPKTYRDWGYDAPLANDNNAATNQNGDDAEIQEGYQVNTSRTFTLPNVNKGVATGAKVVVDSITRGSTFLDVSVNGHTPVRHNVVETFFIESSAIVIPPGDVVDGTNTVTFTTDDGSMVVSNPTLILVAAQVVP